MLHSDKKTQSSCDRGNSVFRKMAGRVRHPWLKIAVTFVSLIPVCLTAFSEIGCFSRYLLGVPCPACGMTRALLALLRGDIAAAFGYHFMFWALPIIYFYILCDCEPFENKRLNYGLLGTLLAGFIFRWILWFI